MLDYGMSVYWVSDYLAFTVYAYLYLYIHIHVYVEKINQFKIYDI